jgi:thioredoxin-like negative regulator of GroEL
MVWLALLTPISYGQDSIDVPDLARSAMEHADWKKATPLLEKFVLNHQASTEGLFLLGKAYAEQKKYDLAKSELRRALRLGQGDSISVAANTILLTLPKKIISPKQKVERATLKGHKVAAAGIERPRVISFYAGWAEPCKQLKIDLEKAKGEFGEQLEFYTVDVDDPKNEKLIDQYDVSPIPTVVFLDESGKVVNYFVGYSNFEELDNSIKRVLHKS